MNYTIVQQSFKHEIPFDDLVAKELYASLHSNLLMLAELVEKEIKKDSKYLDKRRLFWKVYFLLTKRKDSRLRIDARVDLVNLADLEPSRMPVFSQGFCDDIQIFDEQNDKDLRSMAKTIADTIKKKFGSG